MALYATTSSAISASQCSIPSVGAMDSMVSVLLQSLLVAHCNISRADYWPPDYAAEALAYGLETFDFIVVGSGSAGSVVASRLSENPDWTVLLLETGGDPAQESEIPSLAAAVQHTDKTFNYFTEPNECSCKAFTNNRCYWPRGKSIGGSSQINYMMYLTGNRRDYDRWCAEGNTGWCFDDVWPYFEKSVTPVGNASHLSVNHFETYEKEYRALILDTAREMGQPTVANFQEGSYLGYGIVKGTVENGHRVSVAKAYLGKAVTYRPNLKVIKNAQVAKLHFNRSGKRVISIEFVVQQQYLFKLNVGKEVILSAGAIDTPKLLMLSGVGPRKALNYVGIPVIHDLPVGENLQDHVKISLFIKLDGSPKNDKEQLDNVYQYLVHNKGALASNGVSAVTGFIKADTYSNSPYPDIAIKHNLFKKGDISSMKWHLTYLTLKEEFKRHLLYALECNDILIVNVCLLTPESRGTIKLQSSSVYSDPVIDANYFKAPRDTEILLHGLQYMEKFVNSASFQKKHAEIMRMPLPECDVLPFKSVDYWKCYMTYFSATAYHPTSTAKMGRCYDRTSVVNARLKVNGVQNLRVVDASIMPVIPSFSTNGPIVMIGEKASAMIKEDWKCY